MASKKLRPGKGKGPKRGISGNPQRRAEQLAERRPAVTGETDPSRWGLDTAESYPLEAQASPWREALAQAMGQQTYVGGKRVTRQQVPELGKSAATTIHRVKVTLYGAKPPIWRRLELPSTMTLGRLHHVLQMAFTWDGYHLHAFETPCGEFGDPQHDEWTDHGDENRVAVAQVAAEEKAKIVYVYDFGDDWRHDIVVEAIEPAVPGVAYPRCTAGRREAPPEDSGGIWAYDCDPAESGPFNPDDLTDYLSGLAEVIVPA